MFKLTIKTDNASFGDTDAELREEVARLLRQLAEDMINEPHITAATLRDYYGNSVGEWHLRS
jgi:hypothetical protein